MICQEVDTTGTLAARVEAPPQVRCERGCRLLAVVEELCEVHEAREVGLANELALADLVREHGEPAELRGERAHPLGDVGRLCVAEETQEPAGRLTLEQRRPLERQLGFVQQLLEVGEARVRPAEDRDLLERHAFRLQPLHLRHEPGPLGLSRRKRAHIRLGPGGPGRPKQLLRAAEPRHEAICQGEDLRRGAVVLLEPDYGRGREAIAHPEQPPRRRPGERVDGLVVVTHDAEVVA